MKFSSIAIVVAALSGAEAAKLHSLQKAEARAQLAAMSEQMEVLQ